MPRHGRGCSFLINRDDSSPLSFVEFLKQSLPKGLKFGESYSDPLDLRIRFRDLWRVTWRTVHLVAKVSDLDWDSPVDVELYTASMEDSEYRFIEDCAKAYEAYVSDVRHEKSQITLKFVPSIPI